MSDERELEPARVEKESLIECTKCGWETSATWLVDFGEDKEFYKQLVEDHRFMCDSNFPDFEVKERKQESLVRVRDVIDLLEDIKRDPAEFIDGFTPPEDVFRDGIDAAANGLRRRLEDSVENSEGDGTGN